MKKLLVGLLALGSISSFAGGFDEVATSLEGIYKSTSEGTDCVDIEVKYTRENFEGGGYVTVNPVDPETDVFEDLLFYNNDNSTQINASGFHVIYGRAGEYSFLKTKSGLYRLEYIEYPLSNGENYETFSCLYLKEVE